MQVITDIELRAHWYKTRESIIGIAPGSKLTPAARDFVKEHKITLVENRPGTSEDHQKPNDIGRTGMPGTKIPVDEKNQQVFVIEASGEERTGKPENMTHLYGNVLVPKTDDRIAFRGQLDSLQARIIELTQMAGSMGREDLKAELSEMLAFARSILGAEVRRVPLETICLLGMDSDELRKRSHNVKAYFGIDHPVPSGDMEPIPVALNLLRTKVREAELAAVKAYGPESSGCREDIIEALNRLSSGIYILFCREVAMSRRESGEGEDRTGAASSKVIREVMEGDICVEASGRHVHLTREAVRKLFGKDDLTPKSPLSQPGQYAAEERLTIMTSRGEFENVAVLGPVRKEIQVELSLTDARILGIKAPVRLSGDLSDAADVILKGPCGIVNAVQSAIVSKAHIHMTPEDAVRFHVEDGQSVSLRIETDRPATIDDVVIRVNKQFSLAAHLDYDEANACGYKKGHIGHIIK
mgnify:FL=1